MRTCWIPMIVVALAVAGAAQAQSSRDGGDGRDDNGRGGGRRGDRSTVERESARPDAATPQAQGRPARMEDEFKVLLERSIFARTGRAVENRPPTTTTTAPAAPPPMSPEQAVLFVGVLAQDNEYVAFAENQNTNQLMALRTGDDVARGRIVAITLDTLAYGTGGNIKVIHLGHNLAGELVAPMIAAGGSPTTGPAGTPATTGRPSSTPPSSPEQAAILERLRQRRNSGQ